jgi:hypothetical protein
LLGVDVVATAKELNAGQGIFGQNCWIPGIFPGGGACPVLVIDKSGDPTGSEEVGDDLINLIPIRCSGAVNQDHGRMRTLPGGHQEPPSQAGVTILKADFLFAV